MVATMTEKMADGIVTAAQVPLLRLNAASVVRPIILIAQPLAQPVPRLFGRARLDMVATWIEMEMGRPANSRKTGDN